MSAPIRIAIGLRLAALAGTAAATLLGAPAALADTSQSSNWAGYAVHRSGLHYRKVVGTWTQPNATCTAGDPGYSSVWVGIGGYSTSSPALEQIGTELDCSASGREVSNAWYELVPAASHTTSLIIDPGDVVRAGVVAGSKVQLTISDLTRHRSFTKTLRASMLDTTSAEWIVEAPSVCTNDNFCQTLPLADFGTASFSAAAAVTTTGHTGTIDDARWATTKIELAESGRRYIRYGGGSGTGTGTGATAIPSTLGTGGSAFTVTYAGTADTGPGSPSGTAGSSTGTSTGSSSSGAGGVATGSIRAGGRLRPRA